jgi:predicted PurR-regulated permease PerM
MSEGLTPPAWVRRLITVALLALFVALGIRVLEPFIVPLLWASILAYVTWPGHVWLRTRLRTHPIVASLLMTTAVTLAVIAPLAWLAVVLRVEIAHVWRETQAFLAGGAQLPDSVLKIPWLGDQLRDFATRLSQDPHVLGAEIRKVTDHSFDQIAHVVGGITRNVVKLLLTVVTLFFAYRDGARFAGQVTQALEQVLGPRVHNYLTAIGQTVKAVVYGLVLAALVQGVLVGLGYWFAGIGAPAFLAALTTVCGLIPFAAPTVWGAVVLYLFMKGSTVAGIGLLIWGGAVMGWTDHIVRPFLISQQAQIPFIVVLFGVLGGLAAFGLVGLFVGPVILAVLLAIWREWLHESGKPQTA